MTGYKTIDRLPQKHLDKIDSISYEGREGGFWIYLGNGYCNSEMEPWGGMHIIHERTLSECIVQLKHATKCPCEDCKKYNVGHRRGLLLNDILNG